MLVFSCDRFQLPLPADHRFPMAKYPRLRSALQADLPAEWFAEPPAVTDAQVRLAHDADYVERVVTGQLTPREVRRIGFPWSEQMVARERRSVGGTLAAARAALRFGRGVNLAGGTHHAHAAQGGGYCIFNDAAVALRVLQQAGRIREALVVDCDVHQGDGTATIFADDPSVFTLSLHGGDNYPFRKPASDLDVPLPTGTGDAAYLQALEDALDFCFRQIVPDIVVFQSGVDPWEGDRLGTLSLTRAGMGARDRVVFDRCAARGIPVAVSMGGGYAPAVDDIVSLHRQTVLEALRGLDSTLLREAGGVERAVSRPAASLSSGEDRAAHGARPGRRADP
ncbi:MAG: histone deacetylase [Myxococcota bacterium]